MHLYNVINMNISATKKTVDNIFLYVSFLFFQTLIRLTTFGKMPFPRKVEKKNSKLESNKKLYKRTRFSLCWS